VFVVLGHGGTATAAASGRGRRLSHMKDHREIAVQLGRKPVQGRGIGREYDLVDQQPQRVGCLHLDRRVVQRRLQIRDLRLIEVSAASAQPGRRGSSLYHPQFALDLLLPRLQLGEPVVQSVVPDALFGRLQNAFDRKRPAKPFSC